MAIATVMRNASALASPSQSVPTTDENTKASSAQVASIASMTGLRAPSSASCTATAAMFLIAFSPIVRP